jgi:hypothetical protein
VFVAATLAALIALLVAGFWRRFPFFCGLLALQAWQGIAVNVSDIAGVPWWLNRWVPVERILLLCAILAAVEILWRVTLEMEPPERLGLRVAMLLPIVAAEWMLRPAVTEPLAAFLRVREGIWIALCLAMFMLVLFLLLKPLPLDRALRWHLVLFAVLMASHAFIAPLLRLTHLDWLKEQAAFRAIAAGCCLGWARFVATAPGGAAVPRESR